MNADDLRRIALSLPHAQEKSHHGKPDFRVRDRIFATLPPGGHSVLKLTPEEQAVLVEAEPAIFSPVKGNWGKQGWTEIALANADEATLKSGLRMAWRNAAPRSLHKALDAEGS